MKVKLTYSNGDSVIVAAEEVALYLLGMESINLELSTPITLAKIEKLNSCITCNKVADIVLHGHCGACYYGWGKVAI